MELHSNFSSPPSPGQRRRRDEGKTHSAKRTTWIFHKCKYPTGILYPQPPLPKNINLKHLNALLYPTCTRYPRLPQDAPGRSREEARLAACSPSTASPGSSASSPDAFHSPPVQGIRCQTGLPPPPEQAKTPKATTKKTHVSVRNVPLQHPSPPGKR